MRSRKIICVQLLLLIFPSGSPSFLVYEPYGRGDGDGMIGMVVRERVKSRNGD